VERTEITVDLGASESIFQWNKEGPWANKPLEKQSFLCREGEKQEWIEKKKEKKNAPG
jgi:hypothetical protein